PLAPHDVGGARHQHGIVKHEQLRVEQRGDLGPAPGDALANVDELIARRRAAVVEPPQLGGHARRPDLIAQDMRALDEDHGASGDDSGRNPDALQALHVSSPKPDCTSATSALTASFSSCPSALIVMVEPRPAASRRIPMMLLPSISWL